MKLTFEQVKSAARGVARVEEIDGKINFFRFTAAQDAFYARRDKAIGGEVFCPELAGLPDAVTPDLITVAYGTNDWSQFCRLPEDAAEFYRTLRKTYPNIPIVALAPVWRADWQTREDHTNFRLVAEGIRKIAEEVENVRFIDCFGFIPEDTALFSDAYLHPNDEGFRHYANSLIAALADAF